MLSPNGSLRDEAAALSKPSIFPLRIILNVASGPLSTFCVINCQPQVLCWFVLANVRYFDSTFALFIQGLLSAHRKGIGKHQQTRVLTQQRFCASEATAHERK